MLPAPKRYQTRVMLPTDHIDCHIGLSCQLSLDFAGRAVESNITIMLDVNRAQSLQVNPFRELLPLSVPIGQLDRRAMDIFRTYK
jgi:hypothetical protein